jgi:hypothetical protein
MQLFLPFLVIDPVSKTVMFEEKVEIETCLSEHFSKIGTDINISPRRMEHMSTFVREIDPTMILSLYPLHILGTHLVYHRYREPYQLSIIKLTFSMINV